VMKVLSIFNSIDGEGSRAGYPVTFLRLWGCNLNCTYCDTPQARNEDRIEYSSMHPLDVADRLLMLSEHTFGRIRITGGEPFVHGDDLIELLVLLSKAGRRTYVETNGTYSISGVLDHFKDNTLTVPQFSIDVKMPSSGEYGNFCVENIALMRRYKDDLKFVVGEAKDLVALEEVYRQFRSQFGPHFMDLNKIIQPTWRNIEMLGDSFGMMGENPFLDQLVELIPKLGCVHTRIGIQLHKVLRVR